MEFMLDTADIQAIERAMDVFPIAGVTTNPTLLKAAGQADLFGLMRDIKRLIGPERSLHAQTVADDADGMVREAEALYEHVSPDMFVKIPITEQGLKAIRILKSTGRRVTATAVFLKIQGFMALACGADYIAPYYNRMENLDVDPEAALHSLRALCDESKGSTRILAASFKNIKQVSQALSAGAHAVSISPALLHQAFAASEIRRAVENFRDDWAHTHGDTAISDLCPGCQSKFHSFPG